MAKAKPLALVASSKSKKVATKKVAPEKIEAPQEPVLPLSISIKGVTKEQAEKNPNLTAFLDSLTEAGKSLGDTVKELGTKHSVHVTTNICVTFHW